MSVGSIPADLLAWLSSELREKVDQPVAVAESISLPSGAYDPGRRQYHGDAILAALGAVASGDAVSAHVAHRVVGLIDADCYAAGLNFIFGQAAGGGREAFVALPRLNQSFYGMPEDPLLFRERVIKEVMHELGHTWGLPHCPDRLCVMHFSNSLQDTDVKTADFCPKCATRLET